jgi:peptidoglycan/LPS O-acetylase OafA/YrhL
LDHTAAATKPALSEVEGTLPPPAKPHRKPALPALTGIRTLLAINIIFFHFSDPAMFGPFAPVVNNAFVFVGCFFLISGFILAYNYADRGAGLSRREFWLARFSRLYPVYLLALLLSYQMLEAEWHYQTRTHFFEGLILTPLMLQGVSPLLATFWNTVGWTLSSEVMLYIAFPYIIAMRWPRAPKKLSWMVVGFWALGLVLPALYLYFQPDGIAHTDRFSPGMYLRALKFTPLPYIPTFLAGLTLGMLQSVTEISNRARAWMAGAALLLLAAVFHWWIMALPYPMLHTGMLTPLFALLILGLSGDHWIAKIFAVRPMVIVGEATYCLYLLHFNCINLLHKYSVSARLGIASWEPWFSYTFAVLLALAAYYGVENPGRRWILKHWAHKGK